MPTPSKDFLLLGSPAMGPASAEAAAIAAADTEKRDCQALKERPPTPTTPPGVPLPRRQRRNSFDPASLSRCASAVGTFGAWGAKLYDLIGKRVVDWLQCDWELQQQLQQQGDSGVKQDTLHTPSDSFLSRTGPLLRRGAFRGLLSPLLILLALATSRCLLESLLRHGALADHPVGFVWRLLNQPGCLSCLALLVGTTFAAVVASAGIEWLAIRGSWSFPRQRRVVLGYVAAGGLLVALPCGGVLLIGPSPVVGFPILVTCVGLCLRLVAFHEASSSTVATETKRQEDEKDAAETVSFVSLCRSATLGDKTAKTDLSWRRIAQLVAKFASLAAFSALLWQQWLQPALASAHSTPTDASWLLAVERQLRLSPPTIAVWLVAVRALLPCPPGWWNADSASELLLAGWRPPARGPTVWAAAFQLIVSSVLRTPWPWPFVAAMLFLPAADALLKSRLLATTGHGRNAGAWLILVLGLPALARLAYGDSCRAGFL